MAMDIMFVRTCTTYFCFKCDGSFLDSLLELHTAMLLEPTIVYDKASRVGMKNSLVEYLPVLCRHWIVSTEGIVGELCCGMYYCAFYLSNNEYLK